MNKKAFEEQKTENIQQPKQNTKKLHKPLFYIIFLALIAGIVYFGWQNKTMLKEKLSLFETHDNNQVTEQKNNNTALEINFLTLVDEKADKASLALLQENFNNLQTLVNDILLQKDNSTDLSRVNERIDNIHDLFIASINSKAEAQSVLGVVLRMDKLEKEIAKLSIQNNEGAILMTTAALVKEAAFEGRDFAFEAMMLAEIAKDKQKLSDPVKIIEETSASKLISDHELGLEFATILQNMKQTTQKPSDVETWQDRLLAKLKELITINRKDETQNDENVEQYKLLKVLEDLASEQKFVQIVTVIKNSDINLDDNNQLSNWIHKVEAKENFANAVNQIMTYSLVLMKLSSVTAKDY